MAVAKTTPKWTLDRQAKFLEHLAATCNVAKSARLVGMGDSGVYKLRFKSPAFREAWDVALREGYVRLEMLMLERAIRGTVKPVFHGGQKIGQVTEHDARMSLQLLNAHRESVLRPGLAKAEEGVDEIRARLNGRFAEMAERLADGSEGPAPAESPSPPL